MFLYIPSSHDAAMDHTIPQFDFSDLIGSFGTLNVSNIKKGASSKPAPFGNDHYD